MTTIPACSAAPSGSSARDTGRTSRPSGYPRSTVSTTSCGAARKVADVGCGHGASVVVHGRGVPEVEVLGLRLPRAVDRDVAGRAPPRPGCRSRRRSRSRRRQTTTASSTSSASSTACTTWVTRSALPRYAREHLERRRHGAARRAVRARRPRAEHRREPDGRVALHGFVGDLHAELAVARRRPRARRPGRTGAAAGGARARRGSRHFRVATETPMNLIIEARP